MKLWNNMNKSIKTILIISVTIFSVGLLSANFVQAQVVDELVVNFEQTPLFDEANFLPGQSVERWVKVINNSGQPQRIVVEAINVSDINSLGGVLNLEIKEGLEVHYSKTLADFFDDGEVYLSDLSTGDNTQYDFSIGFIPEAESPQGASLGFDILIGYQGTGGGVLPGTPPGGGGGGGGPSGLIIKYEKDLYIGTSTAKITWLTSYKSTSRVIYDTQAGVFDLNILPNYGFSFSTSEQDTPAETDGVIFHEVWLSGLTPNTTYYYRCISHASPPSIGQEHSFTTLVAVNGQEKSEKDASEGEQVQIASEEIVEESISLDDLVVDLTEEELEETAGETLDEELTKTVPTEDSSAKPSNFLAAILGLSSNLGAWLIVLGSVLFLFFVSILIKKRKQRN